MRAPYSVLALSLALALRAVPALAQDAEATPADRIVLPAPARTGGGDLLEALDRRRSSRQFADVDLDLQDLSTLLWATAGQNREDGRFTYPTYGNQQDMLLFVAIRSGLYRYDPAAHALEPVAGGDLRGKTGMDRMPWAGAAAVNLAFVQDLRKWREDRPDVDPRNYGFLHAGLMMQSAGLYAASRGWSCVVRAFFNPALPEALGLPGHQWVVVTQTIGPAGE